MAIKKCPYCKAIIDEKAQYCGNCGTQLLFPEDEDIEEGIPGDRITDADEGEDVESEREEEIAEPTNVEETTEPSIVEQEEEPAKNEDIEWKKHLISEEEQDESESLEESESEEKLEKLVGKRIEDASEDESDISSESIEEEKSPDEDEIKGEHIEGIGEVEEKAFETADLDKIETPGEVDKEEIEKILADLKKREKEEETLPSEKEQEVLETPSEPEEKKEEEEEEKIDEKEEAFSTEDELQMSDVIEEPTEREKIGEIEDMVDSLSEEKEEEVSDQGEEIKILDKVVEEDDRPIGDSGMGLPEEDEQKNLPLPFEDDEADVYEEKMHDTREEIFPISRVSSRLKARLFDLILITVLCFVTVWYASRVIEVSIFKLFSGSILPILGFYVIILASYFFLFLFLLGKTLGDRLFFSED